jgi:acyl-coenzyme A synthetase/AMP-(fatty) acid ligase
MPRFIVIGAGVFGASTVLLFGLSIDSAQPASIDINKVVQTKHASDLYRTLAEEATRAWQHEDLKSLRLIWEGELVEHQEDESARQYEPII